MPIFEARIQTIKFTFSPLSSVSMMTIGQVVRDHIVWRIKQHQDVNDSQARPLTERYKQEKLRGRYVALGGPRKFKGTEFRDWTLRGRTLDAVRVKSASQERVTIGPTSPETAKIIASRDKKDHMWGVSPSDRDTMVAVVYETLRTVSVARVVKERVAA